MSRVLGRLCTPSYWEDRLEYCSKIRIQIGSLKTVSDFGLDHPIQGQKQPSRSLHYTLSQHGWTSMARPYQKGCCWPGSYRGKQTSVQSVYSCYCGIRIELVSEVKLLSSTQVQSSYPFSFLVKASSQTNKETNKNYRWNYHIS